MRRVVAFSGLALALAASIGIAPRDAAADQVLLDDGSRIQGAVQKLEAGRLHVQTAFAGLLEIDATQIAGISSDRKLMVSLSGGEQVAGVLSVAADGRQMITQSSFGDVSLQWSQVAALWPADQPAPAHSVPQEVQQLQAQHAQELEQAKVRHEAQIQAIREELDKSQAKWTATLELGINGQTGASERINFNGRAQAKRSTDRERLTLGIEGRYSENNGDRSANRIQGGADLELDISERWFTFGKFTLEFDEQVDLDIRATVAGGLGYFFIREKDQELKGRAGLGYMHESFADGTDSNQAVAELGVQYMKEFAPWLRLEHATTYYPTFDDLGDFRLVMETAAVLPLARDYQWRLRVGMRNAYDAMPRPGVDKLDTFYFANVVLDLIR